MNSLPQSILPALQNSVILVVDDVLQNIQVVGTMLREAGYSIIPATSGPAALQRIQKKLPDLVLLDLMMPDMDGLEVCRKLKAAPDTERIPIIFLTASNEMTHLVQGFEAGAVDYVTKPFNPPELLARVRTHLELKHSRDVIIRYSEELARLNNEKNEFMGIVAHDLRSPLTAIKGYAELVLEDAQLGRPEVERYTTHVRDTAERMSEMVRNLLDANAIERGEMKLKIGACELSRELESVVQSFRQKAAAKEQVIHLENAPPPVTAMVDGNVMVQILENLISNAIKYSPQARNIVVRLKCLPGVARFEVQDEGPGISLEDQTRLFGKFARLSAKPTGGEHATGLGLSIVKKMVEAMNGRVWCESQAGQGATFIVEVPMAI